VLDVHDGAQPVIPVKAVAMPLIRSGPDDEVLRERIAGNPPRSAKRVHRLRRLFVDAPKEFEGEIAVEVDEQFVSRGQSVHDGVDVGHF